MDNSALQQRLAAQHLARRCLGLALVLSCCYLAQNVLANGDGGAVPQSNQIQTKASLHFVRPVLGELALGKTVLALCKHCHKDRPLSWSFHRSSRG